MRQQEPELRVFKCIGKRQGPIGSWSDAFIVGEYYECTLIDSDGIKLKGEIIGGFQTERWVDRDQFEEVDVSKIIEQI